jgi:hypothetical protein
MTMIMTMIMTMTMTTAMIIEPVPAGPGRVGRGRDG